MDEPSGLVTEDEDRKNRMQACCILLEAAQRMWSDWEIPVDHRITYNRMISHAVMHISRPELDIYPKTRKGTKLSPWLYKWTDPDEWK